MCVLARYASNTCEMPEGDDAGVGEDVRQHALLPCEGPNLWRQGEQRTPKLGRPTTARCLPWRSQRLGRRTHGLTGILGACIIWRGSPRLHTFYERRLLGVFAFQVGVGVGIKVVEGGRVGAALLAQGRAPDLLLGPRPGTAPVAGRSGAPTAGVDWGSGAPAGSGGTSFEGGVVAPIL